MPGSAIKTIFKYLLPFLLFSFSGFLIFFRLGNHAFIDWDESIYAQVAKESFLHHNQITLTYFSENWYEKPPLVTWLIEIGYLFFGVNEFGARFFIALAALLTIVLTYFLILELTESTLASFLTSICYFISFQFFYNSYFLQHDTLVGFFILLTVYGYLKSYKNPRYWYLVALGIGLGVLTKSIIGLIPLPIILFDFLIYKKYKLIKLTKDFWLAILLVLVIILPWHIIVSFRHGFAFWENYLFYHVLSRFSKPLENNGGSWYFYWSIIQQNGLFEVLSLCSLSLGLILSWKKKYFGLLAFSVIYIFGLFSLAQTKGLSYMIVIYPFITGLMGCSLYELINLSPWVSLKIGTTFILSLIFGFLIIQENHFKILKWESTAFYQENPELARFIQKNYPNTPIYSATSNFTGPAFYYYFGQVVQVWPENKKLPSLDEQNSKTRVFHKTLRSVYNLNGVLYLNY